MRAVATRLATSGRSDSRKSMKRLDVTAAVLASFLLLTQASRAEEPAAPAAAPPEASTPDPALAAAPATASADSLDLKLPPPLLHAWPIPVKSNERPVSWLVSPLEIVGQTVGMNLFNRAFNPDPTYHVTWPIIKSHFTDGWWYDGDKFLTNQFAHPYEGSLYFNTARTSGHGFWFSSGAAFVGSLTWELFAESEPPSINDQITTTVAGSFLGEILFRMSNVVLDGGGSNPSAWRQFWAAAVNPWGGFNRLLFKDTYRQSGYTSHPSYGSFRVAYGVAESKGAVSVDPTASSKGISIGGQMTYGLAPGEWEFEAPFDYFDISADLVLNKSSNQRSANGNFSIHGLLAGAKYGSGAARGLWGLFGTYDFLTPAAYRVSSSAFGLGTTGQVPLGSQFVLTGSAILSVGYGAGGTLQEDFNNRDYHFGVQGIAYLQGKLIFRNNLSLEVGGRQYYTSGKVSPEPQTWEEATYASAGLTWRIYGPHAIGAQWIGARRNAYYPDVPDIFSRSNQVSFIYSLVSDRGLGVGRVLE
jgi:hypothetical protein